MARAWWSLRRARGDLQPALHAVWHRPDGSLWDLYVVYCPPGGDTCRDAERVALACAADAQCTHGVPAGQELSGASGGGGGTGCAGCGLVPPVWSPSHGARSRVPRLGTSTWPQAAAWRSCWACWRRRPSKTPWRPPGAAIAPSDGGLSVRTRWRAGALPLGAWGGGRAAPAGGCGPRAKWHPGVHGRLAHRVEGHLVRGVARRRVGGGWCPA